MLLEFLRFHSRNFRRITVDGSPSTFCLSGLSAPDIDASRATHYPCPRSYEIAARVTKRIGGISSM